MGKQHGGLNGKAIICHKHRTCFAKDASLPRRGFWAARP